eukprot:Gb_40374 [translate_table: standard]
MSEGSKRSEETTNRPQDWEVVSLTASAYAAAPGPKDPEESGDRKENNTKVSENESSPPTVHSDHFIFPPSRHEGLPIQPEIDEIPENLEISYDANVENPLENTPYSQNRNTGEFVGEEEAEVDIHGKDLKRGEGISENVGNLKISYQDKMQSSFENLHQSSENLSGMELFHENQRQIPVIHSKDGEEAEPLKGLDWIEPRQHVTVEDEEKSALAAKLSIFHGDVGGVGSSDACDETKVLAELQKEVQEQAFTLPKSFSISEDAQQDREIESNSPKSPKDSKTKKKSGKALPCEAWWKRQAASLRAQGRQATTLWSIAVAAALMGLVILGQRWQHERWQNQQLRLQLCAKDEKISQILYQVARLKEAISGRRKVPIIRSGSSYNSFREH